MIEYIIYFFAVYGLSFLIRNANGPFDLILKTRIILFNIKYLGNMFSKLFDCAFCSGMWAGLFVYLAFNLNFDLDAVVFMFASGSFCLLFESVINYLNKEEVEDGKV